jgi:hypothetical protein
MSRLFPTKREFTPRIGARSPAHSSPFPPPVSRASPAGIFSAASGRRRPFPFVRAFNGIGFEKTGTFTPMGIHVACRISALTGQIP